MISKSWIVVQEGNGPAYWPFKHASEEAAFEEAAFEEAERLARTVYPASKFYVFECKGVSVKRDVLTMRFDSNDSIPF
jgi:hypothetical protein